MIIIKKMLDLESSFQLLSTMSPKTHRDKNNKTQTKAASKLALRKHFRRSLVHDRKPQYDLDSSLIVINDSFEDDNQESVVKTVKINKSLVIASTSSETVSSDDDNRSDTEENDTSRNIKKWLSNNEKVQAKNKIDSSSVKRSSRTNKKQDASMNHQENKTIFTPVQNSKIYCSEKQESMENLYDDQVDAYANILDEVYGKSWREKQDIILPQSEKRPNKPKINIPQSKTERKPSKKTANCKIPEKTLEKLKNLCDRSSDDSDASSDAYYSLSKKRLSFSDCENEPLRPLTKAKNKAVKKTSKKSFSSSSDQNDFNSSDSDSFKTNVRKRLEKKTQFVDDLIKTPKDSLLNVFKITPKPKLLLNNKTATTSDSKNEFFKNLQNDTKTDVNKENKKYSFLYSLSDCLPSWQCDPEARFYRDNYKTHKDILLNKLFELFNEKIFDGAIPKNTPLEWNDRIRQTAGFCYNRRLTRRNGTVERHARIVLAPKILDTASRLRDTLVHEMCHAATWIVNNVVDGHGPYWKAWADKAMRLFPELPPIKRCHDYVINTKYTYKCIDCGYSIGRHSKSLDVERKCCGYCHGKFQLFINKTTKTGEKKTTLATSRGKVNGFAQFVKENYNLAKKDGEDGVVMKHGEVMKILSQQFAALK